MPRDWTAREIDAIVEDYFSMLEDEQEGRHYNKVSHNRELRTIIARSSGSIEYKHCNISAALSILGLPYIQGYRPRSNLQKALYEAIVQYLNDNPELHALLKGELTAASESRRQEQRVPEDIDVHPYDDPPSKAPTAQIPKDIQDIIGRFEPPSERDARNRLLGRAGEEYVYAMEKRRLEQLGRLDLSQMVRWVARDCGDGYGYDIRSFTGYGDEPERETWLEVKTTNGPKSTPFYITSNELEVSDRNPDEFNLIRLYDFRKSVRKYRLIPPLSRHVHLFPTVYRATF